VRDLRNLIVNALVPVTLTQFRKALDDLGLTQGEAAEWLKISIRAAHGYANGAPIPEPIAKLLRLCVRLKLRPEDVR
jgi:hypothetical protein